MGVNVPGLLFWLPGPKGAKTKHRIPQKSSANPDKLRNFRVSESLFSSHFLIRLQNQE